MENEATKYYQEVSHLLSSKLYSARANGLEAWMRVGDDAQMEAWHSLYAVGQGSECVRYFMHGGRLQRQVLTSPARTGRVRHTEQLTPSMSWMPSPGAPAPWPNPLEG